MSTNTLQYFANVSWQLLQFGIDLLNYWWTKIADGRCSWYCGYVAMGYITSSCGAPYSSKMYTSMICDLVLLDGVKNFA